MKIVYKFRRSRLEVLHKKISVLKISGRFHEKTVVGSCFNKIARSLTALK